MYQALPERITAEMRRAQFGQVFLALLGLPFYLLGWLAFWVVIVPVFVFKWCWAGIRLGWKDARRLAEARGVVARKAG